MAQTSKLHLFLPLFLSFLATTRGNLCTPGLVTNITFNQSSILTWSPALNPQNCTITSYVINVYDVQNGVQLQFQAAAASRSYNFMYVLDMCKNYFFEVHALTDAFVLGPSVRVNGTTSAPSSINLTLGLVATSTDLGLSVTWNLQESTVGNCISYYRVVYWDLNNSPTDIYVPENTFNLSNLVPCTIYHVQVNAIIVNPDLEGPIGEVALQSPSNPPNPPRFLQMVTTTTNNTMQWKLPEYATDRCNLTALTVVTIGAPVNSSVITVPITDNVLRPDVTVVIPNLNPDSVYMSYVSLQNYYGSSRNVTVSFQTNSV